jgi:hypothetical protein
MNSPPKQPAATRHAPISASAWSGGYHFRLCLSMASVEPMAAARRGRTAGAVRKNSHKVTTLRQAVPFRLGR